MRKEPFQQPTQSKQQAPSTKHDSQVVFPSSAGRSQASSIHLYTSSFTDDFESLAAVSKTLDLQSQIMILSQGVRSDPSLSMEQQSTRYQNDSEGSKHIQGKKPKNSYLGVSMASQATRKKPDILDVMAEYENKNRRDVWNQLGDEGPKYSDTNEERSNNFMGGGEQQKLLKIQQSAKTHFFDSQSKYVSLRHASVREQRPESLSIIKHWFKSLSIEEKTIALTIVDKELVELFKSMYRMDFGIGEGKGEFCPLVEDCRELLESYEWEKMPQKQLQNKLIYVKSPPYKNNIQSKNLRERQEAEIELVKSIRLVSIRQPNDKQLCDAITIDVQILQNSDFFVKIMKMIDEEFLIREYQISKPNSLFGSLLFTKEEEAKARTPSYFHLSDPQKHIFQSFVGTSSGTSQFRLEERKRKLEKNKISLAKCLLLSFEKCLNLHFLDYQKKLSQQQQQQYFLKDSEIGNNIFAQDEKLATFWLGQDSKDRIDLLEQAKEIERKLVQDYNSQKTKLCEIVHESDNEDDEFMQQSVIRELVSNEMNGDPVYLKTRRKRKDRTRLDGGSDRTSSSGLMSGGNNNYGDYSAKQLRGQYGYSIDESDDSNNFDYESQQPFKSTFPTISVQVQVQQELFSANNIDNCAFRSRQSILANGNTVKDLASSMFFIKQLSLSKTLEVDKRENAAGQNSLGTVRDIQSALHKMFYEHLEQAFQKKISDELFDTSEQKEVQPKRKNKNKKKNKKKPALVVQTPIIEVKATQQEEKSVVRKKSNEKKVKAKISPQRSPSASEHEKSFASSSDGQLLDREQLQRWKIFRGIADSQDSQLNICAKQTSHLNIVEKMLDSGVAYDGAGFSFLERVLLDKVEDDELIQQCETQFHKDIRIKQPSSRYEEERTGLLSNKVHTEKYQNEVEFSVERDKQRHLKQLQYSLNQEIGLKFQDSSDDSEYEVTQLLKQQINSLVEEADYDVEGPKLPTENLKPEVTKTPEAATQDQNQKKTKRKSQRQKKKVNAAQKLASTNQNQEKQPQNKITHPESIKINISSSCQKQLEIADVDEIHQVEAKPEQKPLLNVRKNNFFNDNASLSSSNQSSKSSSNITYIKNTDRSQSKEAKQPPTRIQEATKTIISRIVVQAAQDASKANASQQPQPKKKTNKVKRKNQQGAQNVTVEEPKPTLTLLCLSQPEQSVAIGLPLEQKPISNFELDLSDKVKIPGRGKSISSYGKEELQHEQTLQELDSLFRSSDRERNSSSSGKLRSSTVEASRKVGGSGKHSEEAKQAVQISQFNLLDDLEDDVISHKMPNIRRNANDLDDIQNATESKLVKAIENVGNIKVTKKKDSFDQNLQQPSQITLVTDITVSPRLYPSGTVVMETAQTQIFKEKSQDQAVKIQIQIPAQTAQSKSALKQSPPNKPETRGQIQQYQPKKQIQQSVKQHQQTSKGQSTNRQTQNPQHPSQGKQQVEKQVQNPQKTQQLKGQEQLVKAKSQVAPNKQLELPAAIQTVQSNATPQLPFDSWGTMFQTVYGNGVAANPSPQVQKTKSVSSVVVQQAQEIKKDEKLPTTHKNYLPEAVPDVYVSTVSHEVQTTDVIGGKRQPKAPSKKLKNKQQMILAEQGLMEHGIMATPLLIQASAYKHQGVHNNCPITSRDQEANNYTQSSYTDQYVNSSFQTTIQNSTIITSENVKLHSGMIQERGASTQIQQNYLQNQQQTTNLTYNIYPMNSQNFAMQAPKIDSYQQYQMQMSQPGQQYQKSLYGYNQQPNLFKYPGQQNLPYPSHIPSQNINAYPYQPDPFGYQNSQPFYQAESFFKIQPLNQVSENYYQYFQAQEDSFHYGLGNQIVILQQKIDSWLIESEQARVLCLELICKIARDTFPELSLSFDVYGSMATKLAIDTSDMDIAIYGIQHEARSQAMLTLHEKLKEFVSVKQNVLISTASVPVIKLELNFGGLSEDLKTAPLKIGKITSIKIDIVLNTADTNEVHQTKRCAEYVKKQTAEHPFLKPITIVLKKYLTLKNLNSPFLGTMSSYGLVLLVLALLKDIGRQFPNFEKPMLTHQQYMLNLGQAFTHFFLVYGNPNLYNESVTINDNLQFQLTQQDERYSSVAQPLCIQDPIESSNNVGKQMYNFFSSVQEQFTVTSQVMLYRFKEMQQKMMELDNLNNELYYLSQQKQNYQKSIDQNNMQQKMSQTSLDIQLLQGQLIDRIIMVNLNEDLTPIVRDDLEEKQRAILETTKQMASLLMPLDGRISQSLQLLTNNTNLFFHPQNLGIIPVMHHEPTIQQQQNQQSHQK